MLHGLTIVVDRIIMILEISTILDEHKTISTIRIRGSPYPQDTGLITHITNNLVIFRFLSVDM